MSIGTIAAKYNPAPSQQRQRSAGEVTLVGKKFPFDGHKERVEGYKDYYYIWTGLHGGVFSRNDVTDLSNDYIPVNIPKIIVTIPADFLFGEELTLEYPEDANEKTIEAIDRIWDDNQMQTLLYENSLDTGYSGDGLWSVGRDDDGQAVIKTHPAETWFPVCNPDDVRDIEKHIFAWEKKAWVGENQKTFLRVVIHEPGTVEHYLFQLEGGVIKGEATEEQVKAIYPDGLPDDAEGVEGEMLVEHVPNFRTARELFGQSEYKGEDSLFATLNDTVTQIDAILAKHSNPLLAVPQPIFKKLTSQGTDGYVDRARLQLMGYDADGNKPEYITWDGKLADNLAFLDKTLHLIGIVSETAPQLLSGQDWGGDLSGRALRILLIRTLAKVERKRRYYNYAIPRLLRLAQMIEGIQDPVDVKLNWPDGLPADVIEEIEAVDRRIANGTLSPKTGIKRLDGVDDAKADEELEKVHDAGARETAAVGSVGTNRPLPSINPVVNLGGNE